MDGFGHDVTGSEVLDRLSPLLADIALRSDEIETGRRLPADLAGTLAEAGVFRMVTPRSVGGLQYHPADLSRTIAALAKADASVGWCAMIGATTGLNAAYMDESTAAEIYADPLTITGGVFAPMGKATDEGDHYRLSGRWQWGSGSQNCTWLCGGSLIFRDGELQTFENGAPNHRMMVFPADDATLHDTWHTAGLKGTGSGDIEVADIRVPKARSVSLIADKPVADGALYAFPAFGLLSMGVASVCLGIARGAIDDAIALATAKSPQGSGRTLAQRPTVQADIARMEASWRSAKAFLHEAIEENWEAASANGSLDTETRAVLRLACTNVTRTAADVVRAAYDLGGGSAVFLKSPLQRRFRDVHTATAHIVTAPATWELTGRVFLGLPTDASTL